MLGRICLEGLTQVSTKPSASLFAPSLRLAQAILGEMNRELAEVVTPWMPHVADLRSERSGMIT